MYAPLNNIEVESICAKSGLLRDARFITRGKFWAERKRTKIWVLDLILCRSSSNCCNAPTQVRECVAVSAVFSRCGRSFSVLQRIQYVCCCVSRIEQLHRRCAQAFHTGCHCRGLHEISHLQKISHPPLRKIIHCNTTSIYIYSFVNPA